jgi:hypothetical protein
MKSLHESVEYRIRTKNLSKKGGGGKKKKLKKKRKRKVTMIWLKQASSPAATGFEGSWFASALGDVFWPRSPELPPRIGKLPHEGPGSLALRSLWWGRTGDLLMPAS